VLGDPEGNMSVVRDYEVVRSYPGRNTRVATLMMAGFTSVRNVGAAGRFDDMALRKAINDGFVPGPRMKRQVTRLVFYRRPCDANGFRPGLLALSPIDGVAERTRADSRGRGVIRSNTGGCDQDLRNGWRAI